MRRSFLSAFVWVTHFSHICLGSEPYVRMMELCQFTSTKGILYHVFFILVRLYLVDPLHSIMAIPLLILEQKIHQVPFKHGTLQIGFFNKVLHGVDEWEGQRCGIQLNIKKDLLAHFALIHLQPWID